MANEDSTPRPDAPDVDEPAATAPDADHRDDAVADEQPDEHGDLGDQGDATPPSSRGSDASADGGSDENEEPPAPDPLAEAERQRDEYLDHLRRERAEFENFRRRMAKERAEALDRGAEQLAGNLIGVLDNFGFVLEAAKDSADESLSKGAQMVYAELIDVLRKAGLEEISGVGEAFDPAWHEAMLQVEADEPVDEPVVAQVLRPGYRFKDRVLRPASVSVAQ